MKKLTMCVFAATFLVAATGTSFAVNSAWSGTWKENLGKSKHTGQHLTITEMPGGMMHFSNGANSYDYKCDGKPYTTIPGRTLTCTGNPQAGYDITVVQDGRTLSKEHRTISADGKEMTNKGTEYRGDGSTSSFEEVRRREGSGTGLAGTWVETKMQDQKPDVETWSLNGETVQIQDPGEKLNVTVKLDGSDTKVIGPTIPKGAVLTLKSEGDNKMRVEHKLNGKVTGEGTYALSADGKVLTEEFWVPGHETEKQITVYDKQ